VTGCTPSRCQVVASDWTIKTSTSPWAQARCQYMWATPVPLRSIPRCQGATRPLLQGRHWSICSASCIERPAVACIVQGRHSSCEGAVGSAQDRRQASWWGRAVAVENWKVCYMGCNGNWHASVVVRRGDVPDPWRSSRDDSRQEDQQNNILYSVSLTCLCRS